MPIALKEVHRFSLKSSRLGDVEVRLHGQSAVFNSGLMDR